MGSNIYVKSRQRWWRHSTSRRQCARRDNKIQRTVREIKIKNTRRQQPHRAAVCMYVLLPLSLSALTLSTLIIFASSLSLSLTGWLFIDRQAAEFIVDERASELRCSKQLKSRVLAFSLRASTGKSCTWLDSEISVSSANNYHLCSANLGCDSYFYGCIEWKTRI